MDKPLSKNNKIADSPQVDAKESGVSAAASGAGAAVPAANNDKNHALAGVTIGAYGQNTNQQTVLNQKIWDTAAKDPKNVEWMNDPKSRLAIRMFSRGVLGAAFFTVGGRLCNKWMEGYNVNKGLFEQTVKDVAGVERANLNPMNFMAKLIDTVVGVPIEATVKAVSGDAITAKKAVLFRPTFNEGHNYVNGKRLWGRSLGHEVVNITFDFFCASVGDAWGRDIAGWFDPAVKKTWTDDKGHIKIPEAIHAATKAVTRYVTYNGGEDWAVAIPYAYFMKAQRSMINKFSPGWRYDFDQGKIGGSFKLGGHPIRADSTTNPHHMPTITGSYQFEGALDLQSRFTVYNIGTLMYREAYDYIGHKIKGEPDQLYGSPDKPDDPKKSLKDKIGDALKWAARSAIKGTIIMTPSVPFFWITRVSQNRHKGLFIHTQHGMMTRVNKTDPDGTQRHVPVMISDYHGNAEIKDQPVYFSRYDPSVAQGKEQVPYDRKGPMDPRYANPAMWRDPTDPLNKNGALPFTDEFHPYHEAHSFSEHVFNTTGYYQRQGIKKLTPIFNSAEKNSGPIAASFKKFLDIPHDKGAEYLTRPFLRASISYTPYMYAKAEAADLWDNGKTDMAAERLIDGAAKLDWKEFKAGAGEVWNAILHKPMADPEREVEAQRRIQEDTSAPDIFTNEQFEKHKVIEEEHHKRDENMALKVKHFEAERKHAAAEKKPVPSSSWQERLVSGKKPEAAADAAVDKDDGKPKKHTSYADQQAMRKALEELTPPTNSVH